MALLNKTPPQLDEQRVEAFQAEINTWIDNRAAEVKRDYPDIPLQVLRNILTRSGNCECRSYLQIKRQDAEEAAKQ